MVANEIVTTTEYMDANASDYLGDRFLESPYQSLETFALVSTIGEESVDISRLLLEHEQFRQSIQRAREEMRSGARYCTHEEVFGE